MKKTIILISIAAMFISSCSLIESFTLAAPTPTIPPTPIPTAIPTAVPDPCASENLMEEVEKIQDFVNAFQDLWYLTTFTQQTDLILPIMEMQAVRRDLQKFDVPDCEEAVKTASINYMDSTINYLAIFMGGNTEDLEAGIQNSQILWQIVLGEFNNLIASAGLVSEELPDIIVTPPPTTDSSVLIGNDGTQRVNVRSQPDLSADVISQFEPGMQATGLARNESGDWLQINLNGTIGWVYTEMVTISTSIEELPVSDSVQ